MLKAFHPSTLTLAAVVLGAGAWSCAARLNDPDRFGFVDDAPSTGAPTETGSTSSNEAAAADCTKVATAVLASPTCTGASAGCHSSNGTAAELDFTVADLGAYLSGRRALSGELLADPASPQDSVLYRRILPDAQSLMPPGNEPLDDATIACVATWIATLSTPNAGSVDADAGSGGGGGGGSGAAGTTTVRVGAGRTTPFTDPGGNVWAADTGFTGGTGVAVATADVVSGTNTPELYVGERYAGTETTPASFSYGFPVTNGRYRVTLKFAETYRANAGERKFNVAINGQRVLTDFDALAEAGGKSRAIDKQFTVDATSGRLQIDFQPGSVMNPMVKALEIVPAR